jgi:hypothetical protein
MQYYKVTPPKEGGTVTFLGVFEPSKERYFSEDEIRSYEAMNGIPVASGLPEGYKIEKSSKKSAEEDTAAREQEAREVQEKNAAALLEQANNSESGEEADK